MAFKKIFFFFLYIHPFSLLTVFAQVTVFAQPPCVQVTKPLFFEQEFHVKNDASFLKFKLTQKTGLKYSNSVTLQKSEKRKYSECTSGDARLELYTLKKKCSTNSCQYYVEGYINLKPEIQTNLLDLEGDGSTDPTKLCIINLNLNFDLRDEKVFASGDLQTEKSGTGYTLLLTYPSTYTEGLVGCSHNVVDPKDFLSANPTKIPPTTK